MMMRIPPPPQAVLSGNGHLAAVVVTSELILIDTRDGPVQTLLLSDEGDLAAFDPQATLLVVSGDDYLSLFDLKDGPRLLNKVPCPARLYRLAMGEGGLVVGAAAWADRESTLLYGWQGEQIQPLLGAEGLELGPVALDGLLVDGPNARAVYWGLQAQEHSLDESHPPHVGFDAAFYGEGQPFVRLTSLQTSPRLLWSGQGGPAEPNGFLLPLAGGHLGAYNREELVVLAPQIPPDEKWRSVNVYPWGNLETVAASPAGTYLAWLWSDWDGERDHHRLRVARLGGKVAEDVTFDDLGSFPALAVDDNGQATLVFSQDKNRIVAFTLDQGRLRQRAAVELDQPG